MLCIALVDYIHIRVDRYIIYLQFCTEISAHANAGLCSCICMVCIAVTRPPIGMNGNCWCLFLQLHLLAHSPIGPQPWAATSNRQKQK